MNQIFKNSGKFHRTWQSYFIFSSLLLVAGPSFAGSETSLSGGNIFNPAASVNILSLYQNSTLPNQDLTLPNSNGISLQEVELQFAADVDVYFKANALLSISQDPITKQFGIDPEEVYAESISIPIVTVRVGKFKAAVGKHNQLHTHAYPFIDAPLVNQVVLGQEGLNDAGASAAALLPFLPWYSEITAQIFDSHSPTLFNSPVRNDLASVVHYKNLWDLSDSLTLEAGLSGAFGSNYAGGATRIFGADLTFKYRPISGGKYHSLLWATEYLNVLRQGFDPAATSYTLLRNVDGLASWVLYQFAERWSAGLRGDFLGLSNKGNLDTQRRTGLIGGFSPSEFSSMRLEYDLENGFSSRVDHRIAFQLNFTLGAHPAHSY